MPKAIEYTIPSGNRTFEFEDTYIKEKGIPFNHKKITRREAQACE